MPLGCFFLIWSSDGGKFCILCSVGVAGLGQLGAGARQPPRQLHPHPPAPGQWVTNCRGVPDSHPPRGESQLPRNPGKGAVGTWQRVRTSVGTAAWGGCHGMAGRGGWTLNGGTGRVLTPQNPSAPPWGDGEGGDGPVVPPRRRGSGMGMLWGSIPAWLGGRGGGPFWGGRYRCKVSCCWPGLLLTSPFPLADGVDRTSTI